MNIHGYFRCTILLSTELVMDNTTNISEDVDHKIYQYKHKSIFNKQAWFIYFHIFKDSFISRKLQRYILIFIFFYQNILNIVLMVPTFCISFNNMFIISNMLRKREEIQLNFFAIYYDSRFLFNRTHLTENIFSTSFGF